MLIAFFKHCLYEEFLRGLETLVAELTFMEITEMGLEIGGP